MWCVCVYDMSDICICGMYDVCVCVVCVYVGMVFKLFKKITKYVNMQKNQKITCHLCICYQE